ncbi:MAG: carbohydrate kinase family protein [Promethearchaeota archaeon]
MICAIGNINMDWICTLPRLPAPDEKINIQTLKIFPGGAAANFATSLARLGSPVGIFGHVGDDTEGRLALDTLRSEHVDISRVILEEFYPTGLVIILVGEGGETMKLRYRGANARLSPKDITKALLKDLEITYAASVSIPVARQIATVCHELGTRSAIDVGEELTEQAIDEVRELICRFSIVFMNQVVFERIFNQSPSLKNVQAELEGDLEILTVTLGQKGSYTATTNSTIHTPAFIVNTVDTTGAGDAFAAGFIHYYHQHLPLAEATKRAAACAALQITASGGRDGLPTAQQVEDFIRMAEK